ncbi:MAG: hypothetical protein Q8J76_00890, partial [Desulfobulbaceae bacterium]|nr:hypothetical protein [Desulfobulbaceae bacterium]
LLWDRRPQNAGLNPPPTGIYDAVISLCHMDNEQDPDTLVSTLLSHLKRGGLLIMPARNSQYLGHPVNNPQGASQGQPRVGWKRKTLSTILKRHGLEEIWTGTTPVTWQNIETSTGEFPALTIIPPGHENLTVKVAGHEITSLISQYLAHVLQSIHDHGQYWLCCARKTIEE